MPTTQPSEVDHLGGRLFHPNSLYTARLSASLGAEQASHLLLRFVSSIHFYGLSLEDVKIVLICTRLTTCS
jgi:hypothetical protein